MVDLSYINSGAGTTTERASFFYVGDCPDCTLPIFVHRTWKHKEVADKWFSICSCLNREQVKGGHPAQEHVVYERLSLERLFEIARRYHEVFVALAGDTILVEKRDVAPDNQELESPNS